MACFQGDGDTATLLLDHGADVNAKTDVIIHDNLDVLYCRFIWHLNCMQEGWSPMYTACKVGIQIHKMLPILLDRGADVNDTDYVIIYTYIFICIYNSGTCCM
jgi:hypothetical protein